MDERVGPYRVETLLASGAAGSVYRAKHSGTGQVVALKLLKTDLSADPDFLARFRREAAATARLRHPNVVRVFDSGEDNERYYIAMELMPGGSLQDKLNALDHAHLGLPVQTALEISRQIASGLAHAHAQGVTHRDLKPANVLIGEDGHHALADFGIAQVVDATALTRPHTLLGTPIYMSPEQAQGLPADPRSDLYSLGVVIYELLAQRPPFMADTTPALLYKHVHESPPPLGEEIPARARTLVTRLLAKRPEDRPARAEEVVATLDGLLPRSAVSRPLPHALLIAGAALAALALVVAMVLAALRPGPLPAQPAAAPSAGPTVRPTSTLMPTQTAMPSAGPATAQPTAPPAALPGRSVTATVLANREWQPAGFAAEAGQALRIRQLSGTWTECALGGCPYHDGAGDAAARAAPSNAVQGCPHGALVAQVGEGIPFCVGVELRFSAVSAGPVRLRMNDNFTFDNDGSLIVLIEALP